MQARQKEQRRKDLAERERAVSDLATRQHGVVSRGQILAAGLTGRMIERRLASGRLHLLHRGVYAVGHRKLSVRSYWMAAVLSCGDGAVLSHRSAAALWGLRRRRPGPIDVSARTGRFRQAKRLGAIRIHEGRLRAGESVEVAAIPVTSVARTLLDQAEVVDQQTLAKEFEEADRLGLLEMRALEDVCARGQGRRGLKPLRRLMAEARAPEPSRTSLEARLLALCREYNLPKPETNVEVLGREVDAFWPAEKVMVEADSWSFHRHRAAFEEDRARDAAMHAAGYRVLRFTHRRMEDEPAKVAEELRRVLGQSDVPALNHPHRWSSAGTSDERGQGTVEWVALLAVVALLMVGLTAAVARVPVAELARAVGSKLLCAAALAEHCGDEPVLIAAYGEEVGRLVREYMPSLAFERDSRALPVDFRRCRSSACGDGPERGLVDHTDVGLPVTAFVRVIDCRDEAELGMEAKDEAAAGHPSPDCSGERAGNLYLQYWLYYVDSATMRGVPVAGRAGYHRDDWESVQVRIDGDGQADERASSHHGYNHDVVAANAASDAGLADVRALAEEIGLRPRNGWGPRRGLLLVSGGSHAGNVGGPLEFDRVVLAPRVHLVPLEAVATDAGAYHFAVAPPWRKRVWLDPEATGTD